MKVSRYNTTDQQKGYASQWLYKAMQFAGISQSTLVRRTSNRNKSTHSFISLVLNGKRQPRIDKLIQYIEACGLEIVELKVRKRPETIQ